jgi:RNA 3'-terminal phosphate cyclase (ATP)
VREGLTAPFAPHRETNSELTMSHHDAARTLRDDSLLTLDGSRGEGGGQILRSALSLSLVTGRPFRIHSIRAGRAKPGLKRQHLAAVLAAQRVGAARVVGAELGSGELLFEPGAIQTGVHHFAVGSAGSACLVLQTVLPALWNAGAPSTLELEGGTHNPLAPPADFLSEAFLPVLRRMGPDVRLELVRHGFFPAGGGKLRVEIRPAPLAPLELLERGAPTEHRARAFVAHLPRHVAERELDVVRRRLAWRTDQLEVVEVEDSQGPGNVLSLQLGFEHAAELVTGFGEREVRAETVANRAALAARRFLAQDAPVGEHLADRRILPFALARAGRFRTVPLTPHTTTNIEVVREFLELPIRVDTDAKGATVAFG